ncbi:MAG: tyrosine-type recombinase/integrase [Tannerella sp.]|jgi:integrase/recombinase XerC|nr:tyrosine-type recombinase/integrase [Tannerella sp.]
MGIEKNENRSNVNRPIEAFIHYLRYERNFSAHTILAYNRDIAQFESYIKDNTENVSFNPDLVDSDQIRNWIVYLLDRQMAPVSVNRKLSSLKSYFKYLIKQGEMVNNPMRLVTGPKTSRVLPYFVKAKEMGRLLDSDAFGDDFEGVRDRLILEMLYETGIRRSELLHIKLADVDFELQLIKVTGKRNKQRMIPYAGRLKEMMMEYLTLRKEIAGAENNWFFVRKNEKPVSAAIIYNIVRASLSRIPMLAKCSPHVLRHSFATGMLNNGAELNAVKELLGHSSLASTSVYTHITFEELKKMYHAHPRAKKGGNYGN